MSTLEQQLAALKLGDHVCLLYQDGVEALAAAARFIAYGFARGEQCLYISEEITVDQVAGALAARGVDVRVEQERGALLLRPTFDLHFPRGAFDPQELIAYLRTTAHDAVAAGFTGLRIVADMPWTRGMASEHDKLVIYEALWNDLVVTNPIVGMCQYPRCHFAAEILRDALRTHPLVIVGSHLCRNLYFEPPSLVADPEAMAERVDWMMAQLLQTRLAEESLQQAEARYRGVFESTSDGLVILDPDGRIVEVNAALCWMHGYAREELIGRPPTVLIHPDHHAEVAAFLHAVAADNAFADRLVDRRKDGSMLHVDILGTRFSYLGRSHLLWVVHDVAAQVEAYQALEQRVAERTRELTTLLKVARDVASTLELEPLLKLILEQLRSVVDYSSMALRMLQGEDLIMVIYQDMHTREMAAGQPGPWPGMGPWPGITAVVREVIRRRAPVIIDDLRGTTPLARVVQEGGIPPLGAPFSYTHSWLGVPLLLKERVLGVLSLGHDEQGYYTQRHAELAMAIASHIAVAIENARLYEQVRAVAITEERARIAREMHDSAAQVLFYVNTQVEAVRTLLRTGQRERAAEQLEQLAQAARDAYADVREAILALRTAGTTRGLLESLSAYLPVWQEQSGVRAELRVTPSGGTLPSLSPAVEIQLVRIVQEALANVRKHAHARQVQIRVSADAGQVIVVVDDDGVGVDPTVRERDSSSHFGLETMRERAAEVGGQLEIDSVPGRGTRVIVQMPVEAAPHALERRDQCVS
jgi:PAS domain S-box-containing protein